jgi:rhomboid protease GluP
MGVFRRQRSGSVVCPSCGRLVGVSDERCFHCGRLRPGMWGFSGVLRKLGQDMGFVELVLGGCILLYGATLLASGALGAEGGGNPLQMLEPRNEALFRFGASGAVPIFGYGRWWTPLSAGWLHGGVLHIFFNLLWIRQLAPQTAELYGPSRMVILYTLAGVAGFLASSAVRLVLPFLGGALLSVGASAPIFGLLGALVRYGRRSGSRAIGSQAWMYAGFLFVFGLFAARVDNWAHLGGFAGGYLAAVWLDPLEPERTDHAFGALLCLLATAAAIVASLLVPVRG